MVDIQSHPNKLFNTVVIVNVVDNAFYSSYTSMEWQIGQNLIFPDMFVTSLQAILSHTPKKSSLGHTPYKQSDTQGASKPQSAPELTQFPVICSGSPPPPSFMAGYDELRCAEFDFIG